MNRIRVESGKGRLRLSLRSTGLLFVLLWAMATSAKMATDFNPNLDFSKYKTFAYIGGVESLVRMQLNPELLNNRMHRAVVRELTAKGLREDGFLGDGSPETWTTRIDGVRRGMAEMGFVEGRNVVLELRWAR